MGVGVVKVAVVVEMESFKMRQAPARVEARLSFMEGSFGFGFGAFYMRAATSLSYVRPPYRSYFSLRE